ncbi:MAG: hypothetical protein ACI4O7_09095 [Aristaeellaceae bacterium]
MDRHAHLYRALCALTLALALTVPVCAEEAPPSVPTGAPSLAETLRDAVQLPETFLITCAVERRDGSVSILTYGRDSAGRYYVAADGGEALYVPEAGYYRQAGDARQACTLSHIEQQTEEFLTCAEASRLRFANGATLVGTEEICGRTADVYELTHDMLVFRYTATFAVDQATGVCLSMTDDGNLMGYGLDAMQHMVCTRFITEDVALPGTETVADPAESRL